MNILPQDIRPEIKDFIINHFQDIDAFNFNSLYKELSLKGGYHSFDISNFTECMLSIGINPLEYMTHVPHDYLYSSNQINSLIIPNQIKSIGMKAFHSCPNLTSVIISSSVTVIQEYAFAFNPNLTSIIFNEGLSKIESLAFCGNPGLSEIVLPSTLQHLGNGAFARCSSLKKVYVNSDMTVGGTVVFMHNPKVDVYIPSQYTQAIKSFERFSVNQININII